jgi:hypothetical protein
MGNGKCFPGCLDKIIFQGLLGGKGHAVEEKIHPAGMFFYLLEELFDFLIRGHVTGVDGSILSEGGHQFLHHILDAFALIIEN